MGDKQPGSLAGLFGRRGVRKSYWRSGTDGAGGQQTRSPACDGDSESGFTAIERGNAGKASSARAARDTGGGVESNLRDPDDDPLPEDETGSLYEPANDVGTPPGRSEPGASVASAATSGTETPGSSNFTFGVPLVSLPGRGLSASLGLVYNSRVWNKSYTAAGNPYLTYNVDSGTPAPGFRLGYGRLEYQAITGSH